MISLVFENANGIQQSYIKNLYDLSFSSVEKGGPLSLIANIPLDLINPKVNILDKVFLYDDLDLVWLGRVREIPSVTQDNQAIAITCEGWIKYLEDISLTRLFSDISYKNWDTNPPTAPTDSWQWNFCERDNNNRVFLRVPRGQTTNVNMISGVYYRNCNSDKINQDIYSIAFDYETGAGYDSAKTQLKLKSYSSNFSDEIDEWQLAGAGTLSGSTSEIITVSKKGISFIMDGIVAETPAGDTNWAKITNIRVDGFLEFTGNYKADNIIKNIFPSASMISTDYSKISAGTYNLPEYYIDNKTTLLEILQDLNQYERYNYGFWDLSSDDKPRFTYEIHNKATIHYFTNLRNSKLNLTGDSIENLYNSVDIEYQDSVTGSPRFKTVTATVDILDDWNITRSPKSSLRIKTTSLAAATQAGNIFLADKAQKQGKGNLVIQGSVIDNQGRTIPVSKIRPGRNILISDFKPSPDDLTTMTSSNVLNGKNIFRIIQVDVDYKNQSAALQLDNEGDELQFFLERKGYI